MNRRSSDDLSLEVSGLEDGWYDIVFYDPSRGQKTGGSVGTSAGGKLVLKTNRIDGDLAAKLRKRPGSGVNP